MARPSGFEPPFSGADDTTRQSDRDGQPLARLACEAQRPALATHHRIHDMQAKPGTALPPPCRKKRLQHPCPDFGWRTKPVIRHLQDKILPLRHRAYRHHAIRPARKSMDQRIH